MSSWIGRSRAARALAVLAVVSGACAITGHAGDALAQAPPASDAGKSQAKALAIKANAAFKAERYPEALQLYTEAESNFHAPTHVLMIARTEAAMGKLLRARATYRRLADERLGADAPPVFKQAQEEGRAEAAELEARTPKIKLLVEHARESSRVVVTLDGAELSQVAQGEVLQVDPGTHTLVATQGDVSTNVTVTIGESETKSVTLDMREGGAKDAGPDGGPDPEPQPGPVAPDKPEAPGKGVDPVKVAAFAGIGVGALVAVFGVVQTSKAIGTAGDANALYDQCGGPACPVNSPDAARVRALDVDAASHRRTAVTSFVVGGLLAGAGVGLLVWSGRRDVPEAAQAARRAAPRPHVRAFATWNGAFVAGSF